MQISQHWGPQANAMAESVEKTSTKIINISSRWQVKGDFRSKRSVDWTLLSGGLHQMIRISWWRHQMETFSFSALLSFVRGIHRSPVNFPHKRPVTHSFDIFFICAWLNGWVKMVRMVIWDAIVPLCRQRNVQHAQGWNDSAGKLKIVGKKNVHISLQVWCIVGCGTGSLWHWSIVPLHQKNINCSVLPNCYELVIKYGISTWTNEQEEHTRDHSWPVKLCPNYC